jgi:hypothetical protein
MEKLKIVYTETFKVHKTYVEEIDLKDSKQWNSLIEKARSNPLLDEFFFHFLPAEPSLDIQDWLHLYTALNGADYDKQIHEPLEKIDNNSYCEQEWVIQNQNGEVLASDYYSD